MEPLSPILIVVIAASAVLLTLPAMFIILAWHTHRQRMCWKKEHDRAVESIDQERRSSRESPVAPSPSSPSSPPHPPAPRNKNNKNKQQPQPQPQPQKEGREARDAAQRRSATLPPRPARKSDKSRGSRGNTAPQADDGFQFEGVLPGWGQRVRGSSPQRLDMPAVDGE